MIIGDPNARGKFLEVVKILFETVEGSSNYMDDITISNYEPEALLKSFIDSLLRKEKYNTYFTHSKTKIGTREIATLGYIGSEEGYRPQNKHVEKLISMPFPTTEFEMRTFLGLGNYLRDFKVHFADLVVLLHEFTKETTDWIDVSSDVYSTAQAAYVQIKEIVSNLPRLNAIDYTFTVVLRVDASNIGAGVYLLNIREDGKEIPILFWSHKFSDAATRWRTITLCNQCWI